MIASLTDHEIVINKPKKSENGTYICSITKHKKKLMLTLENALIVETKIKDNQQFIYIKCKDQNDNMCDINNEVIQIVKSKCGEWFNNNMNTELIEDYFVNTLTYNKKHGDLIQLKYINNIDIKENKRYDLHVILQQLRFYKQKFVIECNIESIEQVDIFTNDDDDFFEEDEIPMPSYEEIKIIKDSLLKQLESKLNPLQTELESIKSRVNNYISMKEAVINAESLPIVEKLYKDLEIMCG